MHDSNQRSTTVDAYLRVKPLPSTLWPAHVFREGGTSLVTVDPSSTRAEVALWAPDHLTLDEMNAFRWAYGQPLVGYPLDEWWMADECFPTAVPAPLRVPGESIVEQARQARTEAAAVRLQSRIARTERRDSA